MLDAVMVGEQNVSWYGVTVASSGIPEQMGGAQTTRTNGLTDGEQERSRRMTSTAAPERAETIVIGGGQAGLSVGYHLSRRGLPFLILEANQRIGDSWRGRWGSVGLFTPARFDGLAGMPFPAPAHAFPTKDEMANYLESYAAKFNLPIRTGVTRDRLTKRGDKFVVTAGHREFEGDDGVVA